MTGEDLLNVPNHLPTNVGAMYVTFGVLLILNYSNFFLFVFSFETIKLLVPSSCFSRQLIFFLCVEIGFSAKIGYLDCARRTS